MIKSSELHLTYIPSDYWNVSASGFKIIKKGITIPSTTNFFSFWNFAATSEDDLNKSVRKSFPEIPAEKLLTAELNLAFIDDSEEIFTVKKLLIKIIPIAPALKMLYQHQINPEDGLKKYTSSFKTWSLLTKLVFELLNKGNFIPILKKEDNENYNAKWSITIKTMEDSERFNRIVNNSSYESFNLPTDLFIFKKQDSSKGLWHPAYLFSKYLDNVADYVIRMILNEEKFDLFRDFYSMEIQQEVQNEKVSWDYKFLKSLISFESIPFQIQKFHESIIPQIVSNWVETSKGFAIKSGFSFIIELQYPKPPEEEWELELKIKISDKSPAIPLKNIWKGLGKQKNQILKSFQSEEKFLELVLRGLGTASKLFSPISTAFEDDLIVKLNSTEVMEFLRYRKDLLIQSGFNVILPEQFAIGGKQRLSARLIIRAREPAKKEKKGSGTTLPALFNKDSLLDYEWKASLEDTELSEAEFKQFLASDDPIINWKGKWILIDQQDVMELRGLLESKKVSGTTSYFEGLKMGLSGKVQLEEQGNVFEVITEGSLNEIIQTLQSIESFDKIKVPSAFNGSLRPYQSDALTWMGNLCTFNFGLCLADDMGLGKTIQVIAFLLYMKEHYPAQPGSILIVCPTSVLFNWMREVNKFAPSLDIMLHHGPNRIKNTSGIKEFLIPHRIILTSYGTIRNDIDFFEGIEFSGVIVDESQNMKNYASQQTKAMNRLKSQYRICLSGTPIENKLIELWSLFNFLDPGLLGKRAEFQKRFILPIERYQDNDAVDTLKAIIKPFILRRVKTDKTVINDLPEKNEINTYIDLTETQIKLYKQLVDETLKELEKNSANDTIKSGLILKLLTHLKQICNHPSQFLKHGKIDKDINIFIDQSNKLKRLMEIIDEVLENGEKILIFTQFRQMGDLIKETLEKKYGTPILYFHGGVLEKQRRQIVDEFQLKDEESPSIMILSLKAGGTGLNLTQGTTVVHFDRWWNPAVEDQATDRAYRIGQKANVNVFKFITIGTIEEKINRLLMEKKDLAEKVVSSSGEGWLADLNFDNLKELISLDGG